MVGEIDSNKGIPAVRKIRKKTVRTDGVRSSMNLLEEYARSHDPSVLEKIMLEHEVYVQRIVEHIQNPIPHLLSPEDLRQYGRLGLLAAIMRYDPTRGVQFTTYSWPRIRGAVLDNIRRMSSTSRTRNVQFTPLPEEEEEGIEFQDPTADTMAEAMLDNSTETLRQAFQSLPGSQVMILLLLANGLRVGSVAKVLSVPLEYVKEERKRALLSLKQNLVRLLDSY